MSPGDWVIVGAWLASWSLGFALFFFWVTKERKS